MPAELSVADYQSLAELRYQIRRFLRFSEQAARAAGLEPRQHQLLLAVKGLPDGVDPTVGELAERLQLRHHSVVGLIDRLEEHGFVTRSRNAADRRLVYIKLTATGEELLSRLASAHRTELRNAGPTLLHVLEGIVGRFPLEEPER